MIGLGKLGFVGHCPCRPARTTDFVGFSAFARLSAVAECLRPAAAKGRIRRRTRNECIAALAMGRDARRMRRWRRLRSALWNSDGVICRSIDRSTDRCIVRPVLRVGGLAIWAGFLPVALLSTVPIAGGPVWLAAWGAVTAVSLADDWCGVRPVLRLAVHALAAIAVAAFMFPADAVRGLDASGAVAIALAALAFVWSANLFNFMDGSDGLAALTAVCGFGAYGAAALRVGAPCDAYVRARGRHAAVSRREPAARLAPSWATGARFRSGSSLPCSDLPAFGREPGRHGFRFSCSCPSSPTRS